MDIGFLKGQRGLVGVSLQNGEYHSMETPAACLADTEFLYHFCECSHSIRILLLFLTAAMIHLLSAHEVEQTQTKDETRALGIILGGSG